MVRSKVVALVVLVVLLIMSLAGNLAQWQLSRRCDTEHSEKVKVVIRKVKVKDPAEVADKAVGKVTMNTRDADPCDMPKVEVSDSDTLVTLPITQKVYADSNYVAYVSGYMPRLDSLLFLNKETEREIVDVKVKKPPRLRIGVAVGPVYGVLNKQFDVGIMLGVTYSF